MSKRMEDRRFAKLTSTHPGPWTVEESKELAAEATRARASELEWKADYVTVEGICDTAKKERDDFMAQLGAERAYHADTSAALAAAEKERDEWKAKAEKAEAEAAAHRDKHASEWMKDFATTDFGRKLATKIVDLKAKLAAAEVRAAELEVEAESHLVTVKELAEARAMGGAETNRAHRIRLQYEELYSEALKLKAEIAVLRKAADHTSCQEAAMLAVESQAMRFKAEARAEELAKALRLLQDAAYDVFDMLRSGRMPSQLDENTLGDALDEARALLAAPPMETAK